MPEPYEMKVKMKDSDRLTFGNHLISRIRRSRDGMQQLLNKLSALERLYEGKLPQKNFPYPDGMSSNVNVPCIQPAVDTWHAKVHKIITGVNPLTLVKRPGMAEMKDKSIQVEEFLDVIQSSKMELPVTLDEVVLAAIKYGNGIAKVTWREDYRSVKREVPAGVGGMAPMIDEMGQPITEVREINEIKYRGPKVEYVDLSNFVIYPLTAKDIDSASIVGSRIKLTVDEIRRRIKSGIFDKKPAEEIIARIGTEDSTEFTDHQQDEMDYQGIEPVDSEQAEFWEVVVGYDANKDGILEDCLVTIEADSGLIVRFARFPYYHGRRCYVSFRPFPRPGWFFGRSMMEILEHPQRELNAIHNQRADATHLALSKAFKKLYSSQLNDDSVRLYPGAVIPVNSMDEIQEFDISPIVPGMDIEQQAWTNTERAGGLNDVGLGRTTDQDKTLGEIRLAAQQGGIRLESVIERLRSPMTEIAYQVIGLCYQFMDDQEIMETIGEQGLMKEDLIYPWELVTHGSMATADKAQQLQSAAMLYQSLSANPLVATHMMHLYELTRNFIMANGENNPEIYIGTKQEVQDVMDMQAQQQQIQRQQQEEAMALGIPGPGTVGGAGGAVGPRAPVGAGPNTGVPG